MKSPEFRNLFVQDLPNLPYDKIQVLPDLVMTSEDVRTLRDDVFGLNGSRSDYLAVLVKIKCNTSVKKSQTKIIIRRILLGLLQEKLEKDFSQQSWDYDYWLNDVEDMLNYFNSALLAISDKDAPLRTFRVSKPPVPWLTYDMGNE